MLDTYAARLAAGEEPESLDKEVVRRALADAGFTGDGDVPDLGPDVWTATSARYIDAFQRLTAAARSCPATTRSSERIAAALRPSSRSGRERRPGPVQS